MSLDAAIVSFRLGGTDGVSVESAKWSDALERLGFGVRRVAGELHEAARAGDVVLPWLALGADVPAEPDTLAVALKGADLVVVENVCSLPINLVAARATAAVLADHHGRVVLHHHDLAWQRAGTPDHEFPPRLPGALHVTINELSRRELAARTVTATTIPNLFDFDAPAGDRESTRAELGFDDLDLVVLQPTRAIPRKNLAAGIGFAETLACLFPEQQLRFWLTGPAEDGFNDELAELVSGARVPVTTGRARRPADAYAACDVVAFPSTWEGFGNPVIESIVARRPLAVAGYPVLDEITAIGLQLFSIADPDALARFLRAPDRELLESNRTRARSAFDLAGLPARLSAAFAAHGWVEW